ncbi:methyltransferase [Burkholderia cenocepacia]|uniref:methyltransferase n=1 Tax=Burkholderia cenocepacia TaxID=95486 RepID=UPI001B9ECDB8|nr:class I SAM-dependent methyltransferase [Burkholderia cenocepacia]MBR8043464.1 methyltransferase [Burkholderia cenocepacia]MBR8327840.1 methyltransferase [Burkholderia cenocepacia]
MEGAISLSQVARGQVFVTSDELAAELLVDASLLQDLCVLTLAANREVFKGICAGTLDVEAVQTAFERLVRDGGPIREELTKAKTVKELEKMAGPTARGLKKAQLVDRVYESMLNSYGFLTVGDGCLTVQGWTLASRISSLRVKLRGLTAEMLADYKARVEAETARRHAAIEQLVKASTNPETLEEFDLFIKHKGAQALSSDMRMRRDALVAAKLAEQAAAEVAKQDATPVVVAGVQSGTGMRYLETEHTRDHYPLFVVQLEDRVSSETYKALNASARCLGGWYSSYTRDGAIPGFQFKSKESAEQFMSVGRGEAVETTPQQAGQKAEAREAKATAKTVTAVEKLRAMAERLTASAEKSLSQDRLANTARRARMASAAQDQARKELALAKTMGNLADAIERGDAVHLHGLREKAQVELLIGLIGSARHDEIHDNPQLSYSEREAMRESPATLKTIDYVKYPVFKGYADDLRAIRRVLDNVRGAVNLCRQLSDLADRAIASNVALPLKVEFVETCIEKLGDRASSVLPWRWETVAETRKRLSRMGIDTPEQLRMACREFLQYREAKQAADRATELERALIGGKVGFDFFPTPKVLAERMVDLAAISSGDRVLEPSAGNGNIAVAIRNAGAEPDVAEISSQLREILEAKGFKLVGSDFTQVTDEAGYDAIVMNPPFSNNADIAHVRHAHSLLRDGGRLVTIVGEGAFVRGGKTETVFREWLGELGADVEKLPEGTFNDRKLMVTTGANARLVTIRK